MQKSPKFPEKTQYLFKSDILASNSIVLFLAPIADSKEILTYPDKYSVFNINYYILIPWLWVNLR